MQKRIQAKQRKDEQAEVVRRIEYIAGQRLSIASGMPHFTYQRLVSLTFLLMALAATRSPRLMTELKMPTAPLKL